MPFTPFWALRDVNVDIKQGETFGILGRNGCGKSTLLKCIAGILKPTSGEIRVRGSLAAMLELGAGFQPDLSGRDNIFLNGSLLGLSHADIEKRYDAIVAFAELEDFIDNQVKFYSSGMYVRLGFAVAVNVEPDVLLVDEVLAVGDAVVPAQVPRPREEVPAGGAHHRGGQPRHRRHAPELLAGHGHEPRPGDHRRRAG